MNSGLVHAVQLDGLGGAQTLSDLDKVTQLQSQDKLIWLHFDYSHDETIEWLKSQHFIEEWEWQAMTMDATRPRVAPAESGLLLFLRGVNLNPQQSPEDMVSIRCFVNEHILITCRKRQLMSAQDILASLKAGKGPKNIADLLSTLVQRLTARMQDVIYQIDEQLDAFEDTLDNQEEHIDANLLSTTRRQTIALKRYLKPQKVAISELLEYQPDWLNDTAARKLNEADNALSRYVEELESAIERAQVIQHSLSNQLSEQLNQRMYVMSVVAALFLPLGFLTGLLGVNIGGIPGTESPYAFALFVTTLCLLTGSIGYYFRRKHWL
ncbi:Zinc transport protein ZntB [Pseudoalteromonas holothuriae]|uniref:Zinc transport protein ZntB n=1 Tax=Pseudoalteromonas holothuriae TaxID=2963714 RepID=A0A9W4QR45_9GAMM|nr:MULTISPECIES: zinc transporter ZntB [unclassified Pseudoalteromonas]CAH9049611.1 Zinc transport protein ZntB [Pseudoalteromonas sp. CIP111854]CAH9051294.1 Zinc transport protein ZntB [Pseudoalteromonas sp. CIP111951]